MCPERNLYEIQMERFKIFMTQDSENKFFDVIFEIDGKKLFANKSTLFSISKTFDAMLSERWTKSDESIKIVGNTFEEFTEFLIFIYSGECNLTQKNIFSMLDMAEFYDIPVFKKYCEDYLVKMIDIKNIYQMLELSIKYSLNKLRESCYKNTTEHLLSFLESPKFIELLKVDLIKIIEINSKTQQQEALFIAVYKWAKNQVKEKQKIDKNLNFNDAFKTEWSDILPILKFDLMGKQFLIENVVKKFFLFSANQLNDILWPSNRVIVKVIDGKGKEMKGELRSEENEKIIAAIKLMKNCCCTFFSSSNYFYWDTKLRKPKTESKLIKRSGVQWYLISDSVNDLGIKNSENLEKEDDYLFAEMYAEDGFECSKLCKIEVV